MPSSVPGTENKNGKQGRHSPCPHEAYILVVDTHTHTHTHTSGEIYRYTHR